MHFRQTDYFKTLHISLNYYSQPPVSNPKHLHPSNPD